MRENESEGLRKTAKVSQRKERERETKRVRKKESDRKRVKERERERERENDGVCASSSTRLGHKLGDREKIFLR